MELEDLKKELEQTTKELEKLKEQYSILNESATKVQTEQKTKIEQLEKLNHDLNVEINIEKMRGKSNIETEIFKNFGR